MFFLFATLCVSVMSSQNEISETPAVGAASPPCPELITCIPHLADLSMEDVRRILDYNHLLSLSLENYRTLDETSESAGRMCEAFSKFTKCSGGGEWWRCYDLEVMVETLRGVAQVVGLQGDLAKELRAEELYAIMSFASTICSNFETLDKSKYCVRDTLARNLVMKEMVTYAKDHIDTDMTCTQLQAFAHVTLHTVDNNCGSRVANLSYILAKMSLSRVPRFSQNCEIFSYQTMMTPPELWEYEIFQAGVTPPSLKAETESWREKVEETSTPEAPWWWTTKNVEVENSATTMSDEFWRRFNAEDAKAQVGPSYSVIEKRRRKRQVWQTVPPSKDNQVGGIPNWWPWGSGYNQASVDPRQFQTVITQRPRIVERVQPITFAPVQVRQQQVDIPQWWPWAPGVNQATQAPVTQAPAQFVTQRPVVQNVNQNVNNQASQWWPQGQQSSQTIPSWWPWNAGNLQAQGQVTQASVTQAPFVFPQQPVVTQQPFVFPQQQLTQRPFVVPNQGVTQIPNWWPWQPGQPAFPGNNQQLVNVQTQPPQVQPQQFVTQAPFVAPTTAFDPLAQFMSQQGGIIGGNVQPSGSTRRWYPSGLVLNNQREQGIVGLGVNPGLAVNTGLAGAFPTLINTQRPLAPNTFVTQQPIFPVQPLFPQPVTQQVTPSWWKFITFPPATAPPVATFPQFTRPLVPVVVTQRPFVTQIPIAVAQGCSTSSFRGGTQVREYLTRPGSWTNVCPNMVIPCSGTVTAWRFQAINTKPVYLTVWRRSQNGFQRIGSSYIIAPKVAEQVYNVPVSQRFQVEAGDFIGVYYDRGSDDLGTIPYTTRNGAQRCWSFQIGKADVEGRVIHTSEAVAVTRVYDLVVDINGGSGNIQPFSNFGVIQNTGNRVNTNLLGQGAQEANIFPWIPVPNLI